MKPKSCINKKSVKVLEKSLADIVALKKSNDDNAHLETLFEGGGDHFRTDFAVCAECGFRGLFRTHFYKGATANSRMHVCKPCHRKRGKVTTRLKKIHRYPTDENYICPITGRDSENIRGNTWVLDHDHKTESFRGWLSHGANVALGYLGDSPVACMKAALYLLEHDPTVLSSQFFGTEEEHAVIEKKKEDLSGTIQVLKMLINGIENDRPVLF